MHDPSHLDLTEADIPSLKRLLDNRSITSVDLVTLYLRRIGTYDTRGPCLNSICVLNRNVYEEAQASDDWRASGKHPRPLEGIPFTVKDSYKVKGLTVAAGSPAFADLVASSDAAIVELMRAAGAIVLGKTNMPPMADGGCQRGLYGRSESPYNPEWLSTAYASGSSYGCAVSTAANLATFGFAGETVTSGRSPASNNALVAYTSSRGMIPIRGQWSLYPTCDLVVPHTRTMTDLFHVLNVVVADDPLAGNADFWRSQPFVDLPAVKDVRPTDFLSLADKSSLRGKRIAVPKCFLGRPGAKPDTVCSAAVEFLWDSARKDLESLGAIVMETDFPLFENYTRQDFPGQSVNVPGLSAEWMARERCEMIAMGWDNFLRSNGDKLIPNLASADLGKIHPHIAPMDDPAGHTESQNQVRYQEMYAAVQDREGELHDLPGCKDALVALEAMRKSDLEDWMYKNSYDLVVFPTNGDVAKADSDEVYESMKDALRDGVKYSNGGRAFKHLGIPVITVPMGMIEDKGMPVGLSFLGKAYQDAELLKYAYAYEAASQHREAPPLTHVLHSNTLLRNGIVEHANDLTRPSLTTELHEVINIDNDCSKRRVVVLKGTMIPSRSAEGNVDLSVFVNGAASHPPSFQGDQWSWQGLLTLPKRVEKYPPLATTPRDSFILQVYAKADNGRSSGALVLVE